MVLSHKLAMRSKFYRIQQVVVFGDGEGAEGKLAP